MQKDLKHPLSSFVNHVIIRPLSIHYPNNHQFYHRKIFMAPIAIINRQRSFSLMRFSLCRKSLHPNTVSKEDLLSRDDEGRKREQGNNYRQVDCVNQLEPCIFLLTSVIVF